MAEIVYKVVVNDNTTCWYYQNGQRHRLDGPAIEYASGGKVYWQNDKLHRSDGPAIEYVDGRKSYYINDKILSYENFLKHPECLIKPIAPSCNGRNVVIDGKNYKLVEI